MKDMIRSLVATYGPRYALAGGLLVTVGTVVAVTHFVPVDVRSVLFFLAFVSGGLVLVPFAASDAGLESASVGVAGGFDVTNPSAYRASTDGPLRLKAAFVLAGTLAYSLTGFLALGAL